MKGKIKYLLFITAVLLCGFMTMPQVHAATLEKVQSGWYYDRKDQNGNNHHSWYWQYYTVDGKVAYCIEPGIPEGTTYSEGTWASTGLSDSIKERILLIAYYGYTYPGHQTTEYRAAAQGMLWSTILGNNTRVIFTTARYGEGSQLNIS